MSTLLATLRLDIAQLQAQLAKSNAEVAKFRKRAEKDTAGLGGAMFGGIKGHLAALGATAGFVALIRQGMEFNQTMGDSEAAIAIMIRRFQGLNDEAARNEAKKAMAAIVEMEPRSAASLQGLTEGFLATFAVAQSVGISAERNVELVGLMANALASAKIPAEQLGQEMRSILEGNITSDSQLAKALVISNADISKAKAAGNLYETLIEKIGIMGTAGDTAGVAFSTLDSAVSKVAGALTKGLFGETVEGAKEMAVLLEQNSDLFYELGDGMGFAIKQGIHLASVFNDMRAGAIAFMSTGLIEELGLNKTADALAQPMNPLAGPPRPGAVSSKEPVLSATEAMGQAMRDREAARNEKGRSAATGGATAEGSSASKGGGSSPAAGMIDPAKVLVGLAKAQEEIEAAKLRLGERQFAVLLEQLPPALAIEAVQQRISDEMQRQKDELAMGHQSELAEIQAKERLMDLNDELLQQQRRQKEAAEEIADAARQAAEEQAGRDTARGDINAGLDALRAEAAGRDEVAAKIREGIEIEREARSIMEQTGASEAEALAMAREMVALKKQIAEDKAGGETVGGRKKIRGYSFRKQGGADEARERGLLGIEESRGRSADAIAGSFGGLAEYDAMQKTPLRDTFKFPALDELAERQKKPLRDEFKFASSNDLLGDKARDNAAGPRGQGMQTVEGLLKSMSETLKRGLLDE